MMYYTNGVIDKNGDILLFEMYESLSGSKKKIGVYVIDEKLIKDDFFFKYTSSKNIRKVVDL